MIELLNSKTTELAPAKDGRPRKAIDGFIGAVQMREPGGQWQDIKPRLVRDTDGWHVEGAPYYAEVKDNGDRFFCPDPLDRSKYLRLPCIPLYAGLSKNVEIVPTKLDGQLLPSRIAMQRTWGTVRFMFTNTGMYLPIDLNSAPTVGPTPIDKLVFDLDTNLDIAALLVAKDGLGILPGYLVDAEGTQRQLEWSYKNGQLTLGFDLVGLKFPITLVDDIDVQVAASADDDTVYRTPATYWSNSLAIIRAGNLNNPYQSGGSMRFTGINVPAGADLTTSPNTFLTLIASVDKSGATVRSDLCCQNASNPDQITSYADHIGRTRTTGAACVAWDGIGAWTAGNPYQSVDFAAAIQNVVDDQGGTGNALIVFWEDKDNESDAAASRICASWDHLTYNPPAIHIEYTSGGAAYVPKIFFM